MKKLSQMVKIQIQMVAKLWINLILIGRHVSNSKRLDNEHIGVYQLELACKKTEIAAPNNCWITINPQKYWAGDLEMNFIKKMRVQTSNVDVNDDMDDDVNDDMDDDVTDDVDVNDEVDGLATGWH